MLEMLNELARAKVKIQISGPGRSWNHEDSWEVELSKTAFGASLNICKTHEFLPDAVSDAYYAWRSLTSSGSPELGLMQIEAVVEDDVKTHFEQPPYRR